MSNKYQKFSLAVSSLATDNINSNNKKNQQDNKSLVEFASRLALGPNNELQIVHPTANNLINSGREFIREAKFFGLVVEEKLQPTSNVQLLTTPELLSVLQLEVSINFNSEVNYDDEGYYYRSISKCVINSERKYPVALQAFINKTLQYELRPNGAPNTQSSSQIEKGKNKEVNINDWLEEPVAWNISQIKGVRAKITNEQKEAVLDILDVIDHTDQRTLPEHYTGLRLVTDLFDGIEINDMTNELYYQHAKSLCHKYYGHDKAFKKVGKKLSKHYCFRLSLAKNRGIHERFTDLRPYAQEKKQIKDFFVKHFNYVLYVITGKLRTTNLPNNCGFNSIKNAYEYNDLVYPETRIVNMLNNYVKLRSKVTYFGIQADTMSEILDYLQTPIDVVDHDLCMLITSNEEKKFPGHIMNLNQHYSYTINTYQERQHYRKTTHDQAQNFAADYSGGNYSGVCQAIWNYLKMGFKIEIALLGGLATASLFKTIFLSIFAKFGICLLTAYTWAGGLFIAVAVITSYIIVAQLI